MHKVYLNDIAKDSRNLDFWRRLLAAELGPTPYFGLDEVGIYLEIEEEEWAQLAHKFLGRPM